MLRKDNKNMGIRSIEDIPSTTRVNVEVDTRLQAGMKEIAKRKRVRIALVYDEAISLYLSKLENHIDKKISTLVRKRLA
jgi:hypothetical protein